MNRQRNHQVERIVHLLSYLISKNLSVIKRCVVKFNKQPGIILKKLLYQKIVLLEVI